MALIPGIQGGAQNPQNTNEVLGLQKRLPLPVIDKNPNNIETFQETLTGFIKNVNDLQGEAGRSIERLLTGEIKDVHDVMIAVEKAGTSFELMMEIRNKMIEAYHEILRMQV